MRKVFDWATRRSRELSYLDEHEAERLARLRLATKFEVMVGELRKMRVQEISEPLGWEFHFLDDRGVSFGVTVQTTTAGVPTTFISADWTAIGGAPERPIHRAK